MDPEAVVLDISSDEEEVGCGEDENRGVNGGDDYDWISELLDEVGRETTDDDDNDVDDDDDDVVVVDEKKAVLNLNPKQRLKSSVKDLDDDCMILDGDPDKPVEVQNNPVGESDDVLVVSEKGQVACRDYPHARHLCAKFPFNSSPHESHCDQCHCYVCDSRVPCIHWGTSISSIDHCHATDKDEYWVLQRKSTRNGEQSPKPILNSPNDFSLSTRQPQVNQDDFSLSTRQPQINQVPPSTIIEPNYMNEVCSPTSVRSNTNFSLPNIINPNRNPRSGGYVVPKNKFQTSLVLHHRSNGYNSFNPRDRRHGVGNLGPQSISPRPVFKRSGSFGSSTTTNRCVYSSSNNSYGSQFSQNMPVTVSTLVEQNPSRWQDFSGSDIIPPEPSSYWTNSVINQDPCQPRVPCQPNSGFGSVNSVPPPHASSLPSAVGCYVSTVPSVPNVRLAFGNLQVPSEPYMSGVVENSVPSQAQVYSQPVSVSNDSRNVFCQESQSQVGPAYPSLAEFDFSWVNPSGQINQTPTPMAENTVLEGAVQMDGASLPMEYDQQQFPNPNPDPLAFQYDSWILSGQSVSGSGLNVPSPEPAPIDSGIFFDF